MRVVYLCDEYPPKPSGGIGTFVHTIAHAMAGAGHEVTVVERGRGAAVRADGRVRVVTIAQRPHWGVGGLVNRIRIARWLRAAAARGEVEVIEAPDCSGGLPFAVPHCATVVRLHTSEIALARRDGRIPGWGVAVYEHLQLRRHRDWIAVSAHVLEQTIQIFGVRPRRAVVIHNPAPPITEPARPLELPARFVLFAAGRLVEAKGTLRVAEAMRPLMAEDPGLHLVYAGQVVGDGERPADVRVREILGSVLAGRVQFLGAVPRAELDDCMRRALLLAFPSTLESFGLVALEAMRVGTAVVVSDDGPFPEYVQHGETGLLVPARDTTALSAAIARLLRDAALRRRLGDRAAQFARGRSTPEGCVRETLQFYEACLRGVRGPRRFHPGWAGVAPRATR